MNILEFDGVKIFGELDGNLTHKDLDALFLNKKLETHLLRHYTQIPEDYNQRLLLNGFVELEIKAALQTIGSKFELNLEQEKISTPSELLERIKREGKTIISNQNLRWVKRSGRRFTSFYFYTQNEIGYEGIEKLDNLNEGKKKNLIKKSRGQIAGDDFSVWTIRRSNKKPTKKVTVELFFDETESILMHLSAYPGSLAPDFPDDKQSIEERMYNQNYWNSVAFVV